MADYFKDEPNETDSGNPDESSEATTANDDQPASQVALLPMDFFGGKDLQPGDTCEVKIEKVLNDQVQVSYMGKAHDDAEPDGDEPTMREPAMNDPGMGDMMA